VGKRILVVEDEENIRHTLRYKLVHEGFAVTEAANGKQAIAEARSSPPDLIILDLMLPEMSGLEVCRILRQELTVPILIVTAKSAEVDKVVGLRMGADDYVTKPFSLPELLARIDALLRRAGSQSGEAQQVVAVETLGNMRLDRDARTVHVSEEELHLAPKEFDLLSLLLGHAGKVQTRDHILRQVWGSRFFGDPKTIDVHVRWLREKFERFETLPFRITTVFGRGYRLDRLDAIKPAETTPRR
jgi:DNA-binding response OmpR family regulator